MKTHKYACKIQCWDGSVELVMAVGLDSITSLDSPGDLNCLKNKFPEAPKEAFTQAHGEVDLLIRLTTGICIQRVEDMWKISHL